MYEVDRLNVVSDIELLLTGLFAKKALEKCAFSVYNELLDITVTVLNDPSDEKIIDRVDKDFSFREVPHELHMRLFDYFVSFVERVRLHEIYDSAPRFLKYKVTKSTCPGLSVKDRIEVDYESTLYWYAQTRQSSADEPLDNPDHEQMGAFLDKVENEKRDKN